MIELLVMEKKMELENALKSGIVLLDGAMGTQLMDTDLPSGRRISRHNTGNS
jgi:methionine synthase I (cobalamin-dependent)